MPTYLLHGFQWPRNLIRVHFILQNLENTFPPDSLSAPATAQALRRNLTQLYPDAMQHLPNLHFIEQNSDKAATVSPSLQPHAYVADVVQEVELGMAVDELTSKGIESEQWAALMDLRDELAPEQKVAWFVVVAHEDHRNPQANVPRLVSKDGWNRREAEDVREIGGVQVRTPRGLKKFFSASKLNGKKSPTSIEEARPGTSMTTPAKAPSINLQHSTSTSNLSLTSLVQRHKPRQAVLTMPPSTRERTSLSRTASCREQAKRSPTLNIATRWNPNGEVAPLNNMEQKTLLSNDTSGVDAMSSGQPTPTSPHPPSRLGRERPPSPLKQSFSRNDSPQDREVATSSPSRDREVAYQNGNAFAQHQFMKSQHMSTLDALNGQPSPNSPTDPAAPVIPRQRNTKPKRPLSLHTRLAQRPEVDSTDSDDSDAERVTRSSLSVRTPVDYPAPRENRQARFSAISYLSHSPVVEDEDKSPYFGQEVDERDLIATGLEDFFDQL